jgi:hypothetical protein
MMRWVGGVLHLQGRREIHKRLWRGNLKEKDLLEHLSVDGRMALKSIPD